MLTYYESKLRTLGYKMRLEIIKEIYHHKELCVSDLQRTFHISQSKLSYHLKQLFDAGFILRCERGTWCYYQVNDEEIKRIISPSLYEEIIKRQ
ncbi:ArsR/SmtB family transcription factor [Priestia endophytica]|uniref:ArsR/SmtB family transcription factor n=1 Tax=Priestia endophytica TaxID=135735 RepID=UPI00227E9147|nr:metalloregulator ArsR/SmtB family transcription factor [Priestia endophytica]MCY8234411.1 metalloregulator ArsR/SmtB family transcription factor [Priestia endophytica]